MLLFVLYKRRLISSKTFPDTPYVCLNPYHHKNLVESSNHINKVSNNNLFCGLV